MWSAAIEIESADGGARQAEPRWIEPRSMSRVARSDWLGLGVDVGPPPPHASSVVPYVCKYLPSARDDGSTVLCARSRALRLSVWRVTGVRVIRDFDVSCVMV